MYAIISRKNVQAMGLCWPPFLFKREFKETNLLPESEAPRSRVRKRVRIGILKKARKF